MQRQTPIPHLRPLVAVALCSLAAFAARAGEALVAATGDVDYVSVSQSGYCGEQRRINPDDWHQFSVEGDKQLWVFVKAVHRNGKNRSVCSVARTFTPSTGQAYILRVTHVPKLCEAALFQAKSNSDPVRIHSTKAQPESC